VEELRNRQVKNFFTLLLTAVGAPLILMGDEVRRTQQGNNNAYCQDNEISWFDWTLPDKYRDIHRFVKQLIAARLHYGQGRTDMDTLLALLQQVQIKLSGVTPGMLDEGYTSHALALSRMSPAGTERFYLMVNAYWEALNFTLPSVSPTAQQNWCLWIDTSRPAPNDIYAPDDTPPVVGSTYKVGPRSMVVLVAKVES
ncbi:MAG: glycogen debranching enzyme, partial [Kovacikia sp.]